MKILITFSLLLLLGLGSLSSQTKVPLQHPTYDEEFTILKGESEDVKIHEDLEYFWYRSKEVHHAIGVCPGDPLDGEYIAYYKSKQIMKKGAFKKGLKNGEWTYWDENGNVQKREHYKKGLLDGEVITYAGNIPDQIMRYKNGQEVLEEVPKEKVEPEVIPMNEVQTDSTETKPFFKRIFGKKEKTKVENE